MSHLDPKVKGSVQVGRGNAFGNLPVGTDGQVLIADSTQASGVRWDAPSSVPGVGSGLAGLWMYGDGSDGNLTLVGNTTLALDDYIKNYGTLNLAGFTLTFDTTNEYMAIYCETSLTGGGGTLSAVSRGSVGNFAGGLGGAAGGTSGAGGNGGACAGAVYLFAKSVGGVTIDASGGDGVDGTNGTVAGFVAGAGASGATGALNMSFFSQFFFPLSAGSQVGLSTGVGGILSALVASERTLITRTVADILRLILIPGVASGTSPVTSISDARINYSAPGFGGGGGNAAGGGTTVDGGSGAGGGLGVYADSGKGGDATALATGVGNKASGGGGGSGAGGGFVLLIADDVISATSLLADGGAGGDGGAGAVDGAGVARGGGGGGGGGGGIAIAIVNTGSAFVTTSAAVGAAGAGGANAGAAGTGDAGDPGVIGYTALLLKS